MKKIVLLAVAMAVMGSLAYGQTQVLSRNAVGYVKVTVPAGGLALSRLDFEPVGAAPGGGSITISNLLGNQLPNFSQVFLWNMTNQSYDIAGRTRTGLWAPNYEVRRGQAFWLKSAAISNVNVFLMGEVPGSYATGPNSTNFIMPGLTMSGFPYPAGTKFTNTALFAASQNFDQLMIWSGAGYDVYGKTRTGVWSPVTVADLVFEPGQGFWYRSTRATRYDWIEVKPYTWP